jgi:hypothetical protein
VGAGVVFRVFGLGGFGDAGNETLGQGMTPILTAARRREVAA